MFPINMSKYVKSREALPSNLLLWDALPTQTAIVDTKVMDFFPISSLNSSDAISFVIPPIEKYMLDRVEILTELKVTNANGTNMAANTNVSTTPHLVASLFRNVDVSIGGRSLTQSFDNSYTMFKFWETIIHNTYGSKAFLKLKEGLILDSVQTKAASEDVDFYPVAPEPAPNAAADAAAPVAPDVVNENGLVRANRIAQSNIVSLVSDLNVTLFKQEKLLPQNLEIHVNFTKNYDGFILLSAENGTHKVVFEKVILRCTFQKPTDMIINLLEERLARENAIYHADSSILTFHPIAEGAREFTIDNLFQGSLPYCFLVGVQDRAAFGRARNRNPFSLHRIQKVQLYVNGQEHFSKPVDRTHLEYGIMYETFLRQTGYINNGDTLIGQHYNAYPAMAFDLTSNQTVNQHSLSLVKGGTARITIELFDDAPQNMVLMVLAWHEQVIEITKDRQVIII